MNAIISYRRLFFFFCLLLITGSISLYGQSSINVTTMGGPTSRILVASMFEDHSGSNSKAKVDVFGGDWSSGNLGVTTYYISTRAGLVINKERRGGDCSNFQLKVYKRPVANTYTPFMYDFVIESTAVYSTYTIQSLYVNYVGGSSSVIPVNLTDYNPAGSTDVTASFPVNLLTTTNRWGQMGIGVENPTCALDVNGTIRAKEVKIEATGWADYVFENDYSLMPLGEVASYIDDHGHLPGIPSALEVKKEGISISEMNTKLLEKIEELTLYLIRQQKQIEELQNRLDSQNKK